MLSMWKLIFIDKIKDKELIYHITANFEFLLSLALQDKTFSIYHLKPFRDSLIETLKRKAMHNITGFSLSLI